jgi:molybdate transport system regulatory protein
VYKKVGYIALGLGLSRYLLLYIAKNGPVSLITRENAMNVSARNVFKGKISAITDGTVNAEVELSLFGGDRIVAIVTESSVQSLGLTVGKEAIAYVKAPWVMLLSGVPDVHFSARNQLAGTVSALTKGAVNTEVGITLTGGTVVHSVVTNEAVLELGLKVGEPATALIKASHVVLGVHAM